FHRDIDAILPRTFLYEFDELLGPLNGHLAEHDGIDQAEDGGICADAQRQRDNRHSRKAWAFLHQTQRESYVMRDHIRYLPLSIPKFSGFKVDRCGSACNRSLRGEARSARTDDRG